MPERVDGGKLLVVIGALALLVSLFLDWYGPDESGWTIFEIVDLLLAVLGLAALLAVAGVGITRPVVPESWITGLGLTALVVVAISLVNPPPAAGERELEAGAWIALAAAALIAVGGLLSVARVSLVITFGPRERPRRPAAGTPAPAPAAEEPYYEPVAEEKVLADEDYLEEDVVEPPPSTVDEPTQPHSIEDVETRPLRRDREP